MKRWLRAALISFFFSGAANAASLSFYFNTEFSGGQAPAGSAPWLVATFVDQAAPNTVRLTLDAAGLTGSENVHSAYFNLDPLLSSTQLSFSHLAASTGPAADGITASANCCKADGDGKYDVRFTFPSGSGFDAAETVVYDIVYAGAGTLNAMSFNFLSAPGGGHGPFYAAAHVQNTSGFGSGEGWIAPVATPVPEPDTWLMMLSALGFIVLRRRRH